MQRDTLRRSALAALAMWLLCFPRQSRALGLAKLEPIRANVARTAKLEPLGA